MADRKERQKLVCRSCKGEDVHFEACVFWNVELQQFEAQTVYESENSYCPDCGAIDAACDWVTVDGGAA